MSGDYRDWFGERDVILTAAPSWRLAPWAYCVYVGHSRAKISKELGRHRKLCYDDYVLCITIMQFPRSKYEHLAEAKGCL